MPQVPEIRTPTMARIYTQQGHYHEAAEIYRHLLALDPSRQDIAEALAEVEALQPEADHGGKKKLARLLHQWFRLAVRYRQVQQLQRMKQNLAAMKTDPNI